MREVITSDIDYRSLPALNCSSIKDFAERGLGAFFKYFVMKEKDKSKRGMEERSNIIIGNVADFITTDCNGDIKEFEQRYDEKFTLFHGVKGGGQIYELADELFYIMKDNRDEDGVIREEFTVMFEEALDIVRYKDKNKPKFKGKDLEDVLKLFMAPPDAKKLKANPELTSAYEYFQSKMQYIDKQLVDLRQMDIAKRIHGQAVTDEWVADIFHPEEGIEVVNKQVLEWVQETAYGPIRCKAELDKTFWNHRKKWVAIKDIKTIFDNRSDQVRMNYYKLKYGWQAVFYEIGMRNYLDNNGMEEYTVLPFEFIFFATGNTNRPSRLEMTEALRDEALGGYQEGFRYNKGLLSTIEDIAWHEHTGNYSVERDVFINNGKISW